MSTKNLMQLFKFDETDLRANRDGRLSPKQQAKWAEAGQWSRSVLGTAVPIGVALLIAVIGIIVSIIIGQAVWGIVLTLIVALLVGGAIWWRMRRSGPAKPEAIPTVGRAEGAAHLKEIVDKGEDYVSRRYRLEIEHHTFQLFTKQQFEGLKNGARYAVYYLEADDNYIVSLEKLS